MKAVFWDFDGTLVKPNEAFMWSLNRALTGCGYEIPLNALRECVGKIIPWHTSETVYPRENTADGFWRARFAQLQAYYAAFGVKREDFERVNACYRQFVPLYSYALFPKSQAVLRRSAELGFSNFVLSNNFPELEETISRLGLAPYFDRCFVSSLIGYDKPREEIFRFALRETGSPETAVMIGDNYGSDILGAHAVGMKTVWITDAEKTEGTLADFTVRSPAQIPAVLIELPE